MINELKEQDTRKFEYLLDELRKQILEASIHFNIYIDLWPTEERVRVINRYRGYFIPARRAHFNQFTIKISEIFSNRISAPSIYNVFKMLKINPDLATGIELTSLAKRLRKHNKTKKAIIDFRNMNAAHTDIILTNDGEISLKKERTKGKPILLGDTEKLLAEIQSIFNEISSAHSRDFWSFETSQRDHTKYILNELESYYKRAR